MNLLVTGGRGFVGANLIRFLLAERDDVRVTNLDLLTYAGNLENVADVEADPRYRFVHGDVCDGELVRPLMDVVVTRSSNNCGPDQLPEKLIPRTITRALDGRQLPVYGDGLHVRDWLHGRDHCQGLLAALERGRAGEAYNFGGRAERGNLEVVRAVAEATGADAGRIRHVADRPGYDRRYAIDTAKAERALGWSPTVDFADGLASTVQWYRDHVAWWRRAAAGGASRA